MNEIDEQFYKYPKLLFQADGYVSRKTGEFVKLTDSEKNVYVIMKARNEFFEQHYDKQSDIAEMCNLTVKKAGDTLRDFIHHEIVVAEKGHSGTHKNWRYKHVHCLTLAKIEECKIIRDKEDKEIGRDYKFKVIGELSDTLWKKVEKKTVAQAKPKSYDRPKPTYVDDDEFDLPF